MQDVLVSISCITYNHEKYIAEALDSFLMQQTNFSYEILVHDDASTDDTANIIRSYHKKYPDLIKPILQTENQYFKGVKISLGLNFPRAKGKYIALCEGDDYWTNPLKLQKQIDVLEKNTKLSMCIHATKLIDANNGATIDVKRPHNNDAEFNCEEMILGGSFFHTSSVVFRKEFLKLPPKWVLVTEGFHSEIPLVLAPHGNVYYINEIMSAQRSRTPGSWTERVWDKPQKRIELYKSMIEMLNNYNAYTNYAYTSTINKKIAEYEFEKMRLSNNRRALLRNQYYRAHLKTLQKKTMLKKMFQDFFPKTHGLLIRLKASLRVFQNSKVGD